MADIKKALVCGAGGFIGGHLVKNLLEEGHDLVCADLKPIELWFQSFEKCSNYSLDLKEYEKQTTQSKGKPSRLHGQRIP